MMHSFLLWCFSFSLAVGLCKSFRVPNQQYLQASNTKVSPETIIDSTSYGLQDAVTWDEHTIFVHGERILFYSGEVHPFRLPVADLYLDIFQKIRSLGYNAVSFYIDWALLEGKRGDFRAEGIFDLDPFFEAAIESGIFLLARPGPYINAEVSGGGFPGWLQNIDGFLRTSNRSFIDATRNYVEKISKIINQHDILHGGPVILFQPENEYTGDDDGGYFANVRDQFRKAGVKLPMINNDVWANGKQAPGTPGGVDIYGHDGYPLGFDCARPYHWPDNQLDDYMGKWRELHLKQSPNTPYAIIEFQAGSYDPWGGPGFDACEALTGLDFQNIFYKEVFSFGITILNLYMTYGGTNWGNLGHPGGYTSYDYAAVIRENRLVDREKYSSAKLLAQSLQASPAYWTATPDRATTGIYANPNVTITALQDLDGGSGTRFFVVRQTNYSSVSTVSYKLRIPSSQGFITIPQLGGDLKLVGRDSKIHVVDFNVNGTNLLYTTAEIFTWEKYSTHSVLILYAAHDELHEVAIGTDSPPEVLQGDGITIIQQKGTWILNFLNVPSDASRIVLAGSIYLHLVDRNAAYNYWVLPTEHGSVIARAGYLLRTAMITEGLLSLTGDLNATTSLDIIGSPPYSTVTFNGHKLDVSRNARTNISSATLVYQRPTYSLPRLRGQTWKYLNSLPEILPDYDDSMWTVATKTKTHNTRRKPFLTPSVLFASEYGYFYGSVIFRGHYTATGSIETLNLWTQGGSAYALSLWLDDEFIGSFEGVKHVSDHNSTFVLPQGVLGTNRILTVLMDLMGFDENLNAPYDQMKEPRGIIDFDISGVKKVDVSWKLSGNLGGEDYIDKVRGPMNEGALFAERQGFHQPNSPVQSWSNVTGGPIIGMKHPGVGFYVTTFELDMPKGYDIPLSFQFNGNTGRKRDTKSAYRAQLWVNGYQFGEYVSNIGPQHDFPVPEGILNYHGTNWIAVSLWALQEGGACLSDFDLVAGMAIQSAMKTVKNSPAPSWVWRPTAY